MTRGWLIRGWRVEEVGVASDDDKSFEINSVVISFHRRYLWRPSALFCVWRQWHLSSAFVIASEVAFSGSVEVHVALGT